MLQESRAAAVGRPRSIWQCRTAWAGGCWQLAYSWQLLKQHGRFMSGVCLSNMCWYELAGLAHAWQPTFSSCTCLLHVTVSHTRVSCHCCTCACMGVASEESTGACICSSSASSSSTAHTTASCHPREGMRHRTCHLQAPKMLHLPRRSGEYVSERWKKAGAPLHQGMRALRTAVWAAAILLAARQTRRSTRQAVDGICTALTRCTPAGLIDVLWCVWHACLPAHGWSRWGWRACRPASARGVCMGCTEGPCPGHGRMLCAGRAIMALLAMSCCAKYVHLRHWKAPEAARYLDAARRHSRPTVHCPGPLYLPGGGAKGLMPARPCSGMARPATFWALHTLSERMS